MKKKNKKRIKKGRHLLHHVREIAQTSFNGHEDMVLELEDRDGDSIHVYMSELIDSMNQLMMIRYPEMGKEPH